jgi:hypothetical protein
MRSVKKLQASHLQLFFKLRFMKQIFTLFFIAINLVTAAQPAKSTVINLNLEPYEVEGRKNDILKRNLSFAEYKTSHIRRTLGSWFSFGYRIRAGIGILPIYDNQRSKAKDVFSFELKGNDQEIASVECRAFLKKDEAFRIIGDQDSSFYGYRNKDLLRAVIVLQNDTSKIWELLGFNLNGTKEEEQEGIIQSKNDEIRFKKTTMVLRDKEAGSHSVKRLFTSLNMVYAFTYNNEVIAAVSFKDYGRYCWIKTGLDTTIRHVIANAAVVLSLRRQLY